MNIDPILFPNLIQQTSVGKTEQNRTAGINKTTPTVDSPFAKILEQKLPTSGVKFSQHAQDRLKSRNISFSANDLAKLEGAVNSVAQKGGKESLVMMGDSALVVSIKNRTVVTAMDRMQMQGNVFTNIDSAVVI